jgi:hypothetical protein
MAQEEDLASEGFTALVEAKVSGSASYMVGLPTREQCHSAVAKLYPAEKITIMLDRLPRAAITYLKLRVGEARPYPKRRT